ncbi:MAG: cytotoxic translational repressor of toxin-antitoxin stability system [Opitutaceae bacterium]|jgi:mRNA-degrading endonuclease RelE of RelBE toxin-antitoxin system
MKYRVQVREQVKAFIETLGPESRRKIRLSLRGLESERGDCLPLKEALSGYHRLRVGGNRVVFRYLPGRVIECVFAEERSLIYHLFEKDFLKRLRHDPK